MGLLYSIARVLARHHINLQLAKVATLGSHPKLADLLRPVRKQRRGR